ncbi:flavodoxin family protein [Tengunoibacter tsumagoiensis]|uniref:NAD(P)H-dependent oxidoreductase n=1 Tax=Tengunoibacter tsumagoiensis TaxID=2014871 RepID=A0A402A8M7_9CHLR|nr:flavodoxin family protein [Tengunoibacter tsumagoiensis]GCE15459.1 NAD(P)H-dependent oxidoreductase [Tengunoibacter tsumagoiensis]
MKIVAIYGGSRKNGNSEQLTKELLRGTSSSSIHLSDYRIQPIVDQRHDPNGFDTVDDDYSLVLQQVLSHDFLIFTTPVYWYGMSGLMKNFIDRWSQSFRDPSLNFKGEITKKRAFVVIVGDDQPQRKALPLVQQFQYIFDFVNVPLMGYLIGQGRKPGDIQNDLRTLEEAAIWRNKLLETHS